MFSPDEDIIMDQVLNDRDHALENSGDEIGYDANDDLAFYENLEQAILEQRDEDGDMGDTMGNHGSQPDSGDDYDDSSDVASGWRCKI